MCALKVATAWQMLPRNCHFISSGGLTLKMPKQPTKLWQRPVTPTTVSRLRFREIQRPPYLEPGIPAPNFSPRWVLQAKYARGLCPDTGLALHPYEEIVTRVSWFLTTGLSPGSAKLAVFILPESLIQNVSHNIH
jgi:hypothetical protein